jgi:hypothetical protein
VLNGLFDNFRTGGSGNIKEGTSLDDQLVGGTAESSQIAQRIDYKDRQMYLLMDD